MHKELRELMTTDTNDWDPDPETSGETDTDVAYTEGWQKAEEMETKSCPYSPDTPQHDSWTKGFEDYCKDHGIVT